MVRKMKQIGVIVALLFSVLPVSKTYAQGGHTMKKFVEDYFKAFNKHDVNALASFYTKDARLESPEEPLLTVGRDEIRAHYEGLFKTIPDVQDHVKNVVIGDNKIAIEFVSTGTAPSENGKGKKFELKVACIFELKDGKIARDATYYDTAVTK